LRLDTLAKRSKRSKSFLAAEAIAAYVEAEEWQLGEIEAGLAELGAGEGVGTRRLQSGWGRGAEGRGESAAMTAVWSPRAIGT